MGSLTPTAFSMRPVAFSEAQGRLLVVLALGEDDFQRAFNTVWMAVKIDRGYVGGSATWY